MEDGGKQKIIWGRGIGFKAHAGENYKLKSQDKVFSAISDDDKWLASFKKLSEEVPRKYFELTEKIIQLAREEIDANFDEHLLIPLTDHIFLKLDLLQFILLNTKFNNQIAPLKIFPILWKSQME